MLNRIEKLSQTVIRFFSRFFAMLITLLSFSWLSFQVVFISMVWVFIRFIHYADYKPSELVTHEIK